MHASVGHLIAPVVGLRLQIVQVGERPQGPEIMTNIMDRAFFDFSLFLWLGHIASDGCDTKGPEKLQEVLVEAHQRALSLDDRREHVVMDEFFGRPLEKVERTQETSV